MDFKTVRRIVVRLVLFAVFLEIYLRIGGLISFSVENYQNQANLKDQGAYRIMCIGESTTFVGGKDSYPSQLERILNARKTGRAFEVINRGLPGNNSAEIAAHLAEDMDLYKPDMVVAMIGINDTDRTPVYKEKASKFRILVGEIRTLRVLKFLWAHVVEQLDRDQQILAGWSSPKAGSSVEAKLQREIGIHPKNSGAYIELGQYFVEQKAYDKAIALFRRAIAANPKKDFGYQQLADCLVLEGKDQEAEKVFTGSLKKNAQHAWAYTALSRFYKSRGRLGDAEHVLQDGLLRDPGSTDLYIELASFDRGQHDFENADKIIKKALEKEPGNSKLFEESGFNAAQQENYSAAQKEFEQAARLDSPNVFLHLSDWYLKNEEAGPAQAVLTKALSLYPGDTRLMRGLAAIYDRTGKKDLAEGYRQKAEELGEQKPLHATTANYRTIVTIVQAHGAQMISAPYATRKVAPLRTMLSGLEGILFVDHEPVFKKTLADGKYADYFSDAFAGDFGHGTPLGNRLLADNTADAILKYLENKHAAVP